MIAFLIAKLVPMVGEKLARPAFYAITVVLLIVATVVTVKCTEGNPEAEEQAEQTVRSGAAISKAAGDAIEMLDDRRITEAALDNAVNEAVKDIENAPDVTVIRNAVLDSVCKQQSHRNDPGCKLR